MLAWHPLHLSQLSTAKQDQAPQNSRKNLAISHAEPLGHWPGRRDRRLDDAAVGGRCTGNFLHLPLFAGDKFGIHAEREKHRSESRLQIPLQCQAKVASREHDRQQRSFAGRQPARVAIVNSISMLKSFHAPLSSADTRGWVMPRRFAASIRV